MENIPILERNKCIKESGIKICGMGREYTRYYQGRLESLAIFRKRFCMDRRRWSILMGRGLSGISEMGSRTVMGRSFTVMVPTSKESFPMIGLTDMGYSDTRVISSTKGIFFRA